MICKWVPPNHIFFQIANLFLAFSYLVPNSIKGLFLLRFVLGAAGLFFTIWGALILCSFDTFVWNLVFTIVNIGHVIYLLIKMRPVKFDSSNEIAYTKLFCPLGVQRYQYIPFAKEAEVFNLEPGELYAIENNSLGNGLTLILDGSMQVSIAGRILYKLRNYEFLDSPEWMAGADDDPAVFGVTLRSLEPTLCLGWNRESLQKLLRREQFMKNVFDSLIGKDVTKKLFCANAAAKHPQLFRKKSRNTTFMYTIAESQVENEETTM